MEHQEADALCTLSTSGVVITELENKIVFIVVGRMKNQADMKTPILTSRTRNKKLLPKNPDRHDTELPTLSEFIIAQSEDAFFE